MTNIEFNDYTDKVIASLHTAEVRALTSIGLAAVGKTMDYMESRYSTPIRDTSTLMGDVNYRVNPEKKEVSIGNTKTYGIWVHNGTHRMTGRPYLFDAATENVDTWKEISQEHIGKGMK